MIFRSDSDTKSEHFLFSSFIAEVLLKSSHSFVVAPFHSSIITRCYQMLEAPTGEIMDSHGRRKTCFPEFQKNLK